MQLFGNLLFILVELTTKKRTLPVVTMGFTSWITTFSITQIAESCHLTQKIPYFHTFRLPCPTYEMIWASLVLNYLCEDVVLIVPFEAEVLEWLQPLLKMKKNAIWHSVKIKFEKFKIALNHQL